jgi:hypothetical protein
MQPYILTQKDTQHNPTQVNEILAYDDAAVENT